MSELIQCELCNVFIDFNNYLNHVRECSHMFNQSGLNSLTESFNETLTNSLTSSNDENHNDFSSIIGSIDESVFTSNTSLSESFINFYRQVINDFNQINEDNETESDIDSDTPEPIFHFRLTNVNNNVLNNLIDGLQNTNNAPSPYQNLSNLEDVKKPVKNIDNVAPLVDKEEVPSDTFCSICQTLISEKVRKTLCNHFYCSSCIEPWLTQFNKTCPSCLTNLEDLFRNKNMKQKQLEEENHTDYESENVSENESENVSENVSENESDSEQVSESDSEQVSESEKENDS